MRDCGTLDHCDPSRNVANLQLLLWKRLCDDIYIYMITRLLTIYIPTIIIFNRYKFWKLWPQHMMQMSKVNRYCFVVWVNTAWNTGNHYFPVGWRRKEMVMKLIGSFKLIILQLFSINFALSLSDSRVKTQDSVNRCLELEHGTSPLTNVWNWNVELSC